MSDPNPDRTIDGRTMAELRAAELDEDMAYDRGDHIRREWAMQQAMAIARKTDAEIMGTSHAGAEVDASLAAEIRRQRAKKFAAMLQVAEDVGDPLIVEAARALLYPGKDHAPDSHG